MKMKRNSYAKKRGMKIRKHTFTAVAALFVLILVLTVFFTGRQAKAGGLDPDNTNTSGVKYYTSYEVQSGDTLWTIAGVYCGEGQNVQDYVEEVCRINHLSDGNQIFAGNKICIPYYQN